MKRPQRRPRCTVEECREPASHAFLGVTGDQAVKVTFADGRRIRTCQPHFMLVVDRLHKAFAELPDGGPARLRAVPLVAA